MPDYDINPDTYRRWSVSDNAYWLLERTRFFDVLGSVRDLNILELACGDGRISRILMDRGARSVLGTDISEEMIKRAVAQNKNDQGGLVYLNLSFEVVDACDETFTLAHPVDLVTAMYLFHYAPSKEALGRMCRLISRNLKPGGRFVAHTVNPDFDFTRIDPRLASCFGFSYRPIEPPHYEVMFGEFAANMWHWSKEAHEEGLQGGGLTDVCWYSLCFPDDHRDLARSLQWYLDNPSCIVVSAEKPK